MCRWGKWFSESSTTPREPGSTNWGPLPLDRFWSFCNLSVLPCKYFIVSIETFRGVYISYLYILMKTLHMCKNYQQLTHSTTTRITVGDIRSENVALAAWRKWLCEGDAGKAKKAGSFNWAPMPSMSIAPCYPNMALLMLKRPRNFSECLDWSSMPSMFIAPPLKPQWCWKDKKIKGKCSFQALRKQYRILSER